MLIEDTAYELPELNHLPWSPGVSAYNQAEANTVQNFINKPIVITEKMDGLSCCMTKNKLYCNGLDVTSGDIYSGTNKESINLLRYRYNELTKMIFHESAIFVEWCYAVRDHVYYDLEDYPFVIGVREDSGEWWGWKDIKCYINQMDMNTVPVLFSGTIKMVSELKDICEYLMKGRSLFGVEKEGLVVRIEGNFADEDYKKNVVACSKNLIKLVGSGRYANLGKINCRRPGCFKLEQVGKPL